MPHLSQRAVLTALIAGSCLGAPAAAAARHPQERAPVTIERIPRFDHVIVIVEENKDYDQILSPDAAPHIAALAKAYGNATAFHGETHPSEGNYVALLAGSTFGIHDDDAYYCRAGSKQAHCDGAAAAGYANHTVTARHLGDQLSAASLSWKGYYESLPAPGSGAVVATDPAYPGTAPDTAFYASKHSGFMNFADVQSASDRAQRIVGFDVLDRDLATGRLPAFALVVPNQCNEMHGLHGAGIPADCDGADKAALIRRGDAYTDMLVRRFQQTAAWRGAGNVAIVITFDEGANRTREGCCGAVATPGSTLGGGHIPTIVITNHGPRGVSDATPYNHYSLLRTIEDAFGIDEHLGKAAARDEGVVPMVKLFAAAG